MRIDEVDALDDALDLDGLRAIEATETVMGERGRRSRERGDKEYGSTEPEPRGGVAAIPTNFDCLVHVSSPRTEKAERKRDAVAAANRGDAGECDHAEGVTGKVVRTAYGPTAFDRRS
jgi:hypothetical protein